MSEGQSVQTRVLLLFLHEILLPSIKERHTIPIIDIIPVGIVAFVFKSVWDSLCRNSCINSAKQSNVLTQSKLLDGADTLSMSCGLNK